MEVAWRGEAIENKGEPWVLLTGSEDDEPIVMEATAGRRQCPNRGGSYAGSSVTGNTAQASQ
jgi:hypothetical protein